jgi:plasmid stability protein
VEALNVRVDSKTKKALTARAKGQHRTTSDQARRYLEIAMIAEDNPDLPYSMIEGILEGVAELSAGLAEPYDWTIYEDKPKR